jgi:ABC-type maltose transport system permease subunit
MLDKMRTSLNMFILFMFVVAIVYGIIAVIFNSFNKDNINNSTPVQPQNVDVYIKEENLLTNDYSTFFTLENCIHSIIATLNEDKISDVYNILIDDVKNQIGKDKSKLIDYCNQNFKYEVVSGMDIEGYQNLNNLKQVYKVDNSNYICIVTSINESKLTKIGIKLINGSSYMISYIEL